MRPISLSVTWNWQIGFAAAFGGYNSTLIRFRVPAMISRLTTLIAAVLALLSGAVANGHHSFAAEFQADEIQTIEGIVEQVWFKNPHVRYYVNVAGSDGEVVKWDTRGSSPSLLVRKGWNKTTIKVGDTVKITGYLGRDGRKLMFIISAVLEDGTVLGNPYDAIK